MRTGRTSGPTSLLDIETLDDLLGHPVVGGWWLVVGGSWEGYITENLLAAVPAGTQAGFYRTRVGAEIDLVLSMERQLWAIEIKRTLAPQPSKGYWLACEDLQPDAKFVVYPGDERFTVSAEEWARKSSE